MFSSMLLSKPAGMESVHATARQHMRFEDASPALQELITDFVDTIYDSFDLNGSKALDFTEVHAAMMRNTSITDVWEVFGRTIVSRI